MPAATMLDDETATLRPRNENDDADGSDAEEPDDDADGSDAE